MTRSTMTRSPSSSSWLAPAVLFLLCIVAALVRIGVQPSATSDRGSPQSQAKNARRTEESLKSNEKMRSLVGGYSDMDVELLQSEEVAAIATFALEQHAAGASAFDSTSLAVSPSEVEGGAVQMKVLEAQRQVVAGLNYKLTVAVFRENVCLGAFKVTVYKPLPHTGQGPTVNSWGDALECGEIADLLDAAPGEEGKALRVEAERKEEQEEVEPDS